MRPRFPYVTRALSQTFRKQCGAVYYVWRVVGD